ncbi:MAG: GH32 C-terminal domain-containing protein, partial [Armatimonadota bacterium]
PHGKRPPASHRVLEAGDILIADFEGEDYGAWTVAGEAFGPGPARGTLPGQMRVSGFQGNALVNTYYQGDGTTGTLTSPTFRIERKYINFLIGGGGYAGDTCIDLIVNAEVVRTATGPNTRPGGSERLAWHSWDVAELAGQQAVIRIVDKRTGGWGHINIDHIVQSDQKREEVPAMREITIERRYLHLPVENGAPKRKMRFEADGETVREFEIELAEAEPDFWAFSDVSAFDGKQLALHVDRLPDGSQGLASIIQADEVPDADDLYKEKHRPQLHFSSRRGWNNDPNGLVYYRGEYHLYYQHNPYGWKWGNMHWGHAVSPDLVHWQELPVALYPHRFGDWCFSGSAAVDWSNSAGFKTGDDDVIIAAYTSTGRGESIAYSNDRGRTFTDYEGNPVVEHSGRDPKIIWYEPGEQWVMAVYDQRDDSKGIAFYTSTDLKQWEYQSRIDGYYECPEFFELPVEGDPDTRKWVVYGANGDYAIGSFDGKSFTTESGKHRLNHGNCFYASQTFSDIPPEDGRRIQIAWGRIGHPDMPFNQMMDFPVELTLRTTEEGLRLFAEPVREIELLHERRHAFDGRRIGEGDNPLKDIAGDLFHILAEFEIGEAQELGFVIRGVPVTYDVGRRELSCRDKKAALGPSDGRIRLALLVDRMSIEIFANDGRV